MESMTTQNITRMIDAMSVDELRMRLAAYMMAEQQKALQPIAIEVRLSDILNRGGRYDVFFVMENNEEVEVKFTDRYSRLIYIYTLLHPKGFQRRSLHVVGTTAEVDRQIWLRSVLLSGCRTVESSCAQCHQCIR